MTRDAIMAELLEIEGQLQNDRLNDNDRLALQGAQQALGHILDPETWHQASQTFYRIDNKPSEAVSLLLALSTRGCPIMRGPTVRRHLDPAFAQLSAGALERLCHVSHPLDSHL